jgi:hypothetical protein
VGDVIQKPVIGSMEIMETVGLAAQTEEGHSTRALRGNFQRENKG